MDVVEPDHHLGGVGWDGVVGGEGCRGTDGAGWEGLGECLSQQ